MTVKDIACCSYIIERSWMSDLREQMPEKALEFTNIRHVATAACWISVLEGHVIDELGLGSHMTRDVCLLLPYMLTYKPKGKLYCLCMQTK